MPFMPRLNCLKISALHIKNLATSLTGDLIIIFLFVPVLPYHFYVVKK